MATPTADIIPNIERDYPMQPVAVIGNISDLDMDAKMNVTNQYIIGLTTDDTYPGGIDQYKHKMIESLKQVSPSVRVLGWPFEMEEMAEVRQALADLAAYFNANLDINKMVERVAGRDANHYYITITVVQIPMFHA